jgi:hypothetical protein
MATTQRYGFQTIGSKKTPFSTLRQPAGTSPLKSPYAATATQNLVSDVLSSTNPFTKSKPTMPSLTSGLGGASGYGLLNPTPTTPATITAPKAPAAPQAPSVPSSVNDLTADPILNWTQQLGQKNVQDATSSALANAKNAIVRSGLSQVPDTLRLQFANDPTSPVLGALTDAMTLQAAGQNPDSALAQLSKQHPLVQSSLDAQHNAANTFYGSRHAEALAQEADQYRQAQQGVYGDLGSTLSQIVQGVLSTKQNASDQYTSQLPGAYQRVLDQGAGPVVDNGGTDTNGPAGPGSVTPPAGGDTIAPANTGRAQISNLGGLFQMLQQARPPARSGGAGGRPFLAA